MEDPASREKRLEKYIRENQKELAVNLIIFRQGEINSNLYFINSGEIKMFYHKDKHGSRDGKIVGVHGQMFNEYLVNVKWDEPLDGGVMERIKLAGDRHEIY